MSAAGNAIGAAIVANKGAAQLAFLASLKGRSATVTDNLRLSLMMAQSEGNAIVDNLPATQEEGTISISVVAAAALQAGQPVYVNPTTGQAAPASCAGYATSFVAGLAASATAATFAVNLITDSLTLQDWSVITGTSSLYRGQPYFLGISPGTLSLAAPIARGQSRVIVGLALSTVQMLIRPTQPILL